MTRLTFQQGHRLQRPGLNAQQRADKAHDAGVPVDLDTQVPALEKRYAAATVELNTLQKRYPAAVDELKKHDKERSQAAFDKLQAAYGTAPERDKNFAAGTLSKQARLIADQRAECEGLAGQIRVHEARLARSGG